VWKGKKMAGQMGNQKKTTQSLEVVRIDLENNLLLIKGAVPGATGSKVVVRPAVKAKG
jgi:large subunit ribosomal protein L3